MKNYFKVLFVAVATVIVFHGLLLFIVYSCHANPAVMPIVVADLVIFFVSAIIYGGLFSEQ